MKLMIIGHGGHGKDEVADLIAGRLHLRSIASSLFCAQKFIYDALKDKYGYRNLFECFNDRRNHRAEWYDLICEYNSEDPCRMMKELYQEYDIYTGLRSRREFEAGKKEGLFDLVIWVDGSKREPPEDPSSMDLTEDDADVVIPNNGTLEELDDRVFRLCLLLKEPERYAEGSLDASVLDCVSRAGYLIQTVCFSLSRKAGWWTDLQTGESLMGAPRIVEQKLALIHSEVSEALEGHRKDLMDDKLPHRKMVEVELADAVIRIADLAGAMGLKLGQAMAEKLQYNTTREDHKLENRRKVGGKSC